MRRCVDGNEASCCLAKVLALCPTRVAFATEEQHMVTSARARRPLCAFRFFHVANHCDAQRQSS
eukprot:4193080-Lingulodinium_polyedra.AAC.1